MSLLLGHSEPGTHLPVHELKNKPSLQSQYGVCNGNFKQGRGVLKFLHELWVQSSYLEEKLKLRYF